MQQAHRDAVWIRCLPSIHPPQHHMDFVLCYADDVTILSRRPAGSSSRLANLEAGVECVQLIGKCGVFFFIVRNSA